MAWRATGTATEHPDTFPMIPFHYILAVLVVMLASTTAHAVGGIDLRTERTAFSTLAIGRADTLIVKMTIQLDIVDRYTLTLDEAGTYKAIRSTRLAYPEEERSLVLAPGDTLDIPFVFTPNSDGSYSRTLTVSSVYAGRQSITLTGTCDGSLPSVYGPGGLDLGQDDVIVGTVVPVSISLVNITATTADVRLNIPERDGFAFSRPQDTAVALPAKDTATILVAFRPETASAVSVKAALRQPDGLLEPFTISGTGVVGSGISIAGLADTLFADSVGQVVRDTIIIRNGGPTTHRIQYFREQSDRTWRIGRYSQDEQTLLPGDSLALTVDIPVVDSIPETRYWYWRFGSSLYGGTSTTVAFRSPGNDTMAVDTTDPGDTTATDTTDIGTDSMAVDTVGIIMTTQHRADGTTMMTATAATDLPDTLTAVEFDVLVDSTTFVLPSAIGDANLSLLTVRRTLTNHTVGTTLLELTLQRRYPLTNPPAPIVADVRWFAAGGDTVDITGFIESNTTTDVAEAEQWRRTVTLSPMVPSTTVVITRHGTHEGAWTMIDLLGTTVARGTLAGERTEVAVSTLPPGTYFAVVVLEGGRGGVVTLPFLRR